MEKNKKCTPVYLNTIQQEKLEKIKEKSGKSQAEIMKESIEIGLNQSLSSVHNENKTKRIYFMVKVKVNKELLTEFGKALANNELDRSSVKSETFCIKNDPAIGYSIWETETKEEFDKKFGPWKRFYFETETTEMITPNEAMLALMKK